MCRHRRPRLSTRSPAKPPPGLVSSISRDPRDRLLRFGTRPLSRKKAKGKNQKAKGKSRRNRNPDSSSLYFCLLTFAFCLFPELLVSQRGILSARSRSAGRGVGRTRLGRLAGRAGSGRLGFRAALDRFALVIFVHTSIRRCSGVKGKSKNVMSGISRRYPLRPGAVDVGAHLADFVGDLLQVRFQYIAEREHSREASFGEHRQVPAANVAHYLEAVFDGGADVHGHRTGGHHLDRKSTRLNSSHIQKSRMPSSA